MKHTDLLYSIFEQHLFSALVEEESNQEFLDRVVRDYMQRLPTTGNFVSACHAEQLQEDLREEVLEMLQKKTYGHYNLNAFRQSHFRAPTISTNDDRYQQKLRKRRAV